MFDKYPSYKIVTHKEILIKLSKLVDTSKLYVMYNCSCRILNKTRNMVSIVTPPSLIGPHFKFLYMQRVWTNVCSFIVSIAVVTKVTTRVATCVGVTYMTSLELMTSSNVFRTPLCIERCSKLNAEQDLATNYTLYCNYIEIYSVNGRKMI